MTTLVWLAGGLTIVVVYPFVAGLVLRRLYAEWDVSGFLVLLPFAGPIMAFGCGVRGALGDPLNDYEASMFAAGWPLAIAGFLVAKLCIALAYAPRAMFRLGAGRIGGTP